MDRALVFGTKGRGFESLRACQRIQNPKRVSCVIKKNPATNALFRVGPHLVKTKSTIRWPWPVTLTFKSTLPPRLPPGTRSGPGPEYIPRDPLLASLNSFGATPDVASPIQSAKTSYQSSSSQIVRFRNFTAMTILKVRHLTLKNRVLLFQLGSIPGSQKILNLVID